MPLLNRNLPSEWRLTRKEYMVVANSGEGRKKKKSLDMVVNQGFKDEGEIK